MQISLKLYKHLLVTVVLWRFREFGWLAGVVVGVLRRCYRVLIAKLWCLCRNEGTICFIWRPWGWRWKEDAVESLESEVVVPVVVVTRRRQEVTRDSRR